jgi:hypothetical protein
MPRKNSPSRGRRRQPPPIAEPAERSPEGLSWSLVRRGLASAAILDSPNPNKETNR